MAIIVNTNMTALKSQKNLTNATNSMSKSLERMSTGYKINHAKDDAAGLYVATGLETQIRGSKVAKNNISTGNSVLQIMESDLDNILTNLQRIRDLAVQAANSVYSDDAMGAMEEEVFARLDEIDRLSEASEFNGLKLLNGTGQLADNGLRLQVGANTNAAANCIDLDVSMFNVAMNSDELGKGTSTDKFNDGYDNVSTISDQSSIRSAVGDSSEARADRTEGAFMAATTAANYISIVDTAINNIANKKSKIGAVMNRLEAAETSLTTTIENNTAARSTIMDADVAEESMEYTKARILQQTSAALLVQANSLPSIAISLVQG